MAGTPIEQLQLSVRASNALHVLHRKTAASLRHFAVRKRLAG